MTARGRLARAACAALLAGLGTDAAAAGLQPRTAAAFDRYARLTEARIEAEAGGLRPFLWLNRLGDAERRAAGAALARGEVLVQRLRTTDEGRGIDVPGGLVHHWVGTVFVPRADLARAVAAMQDYDRYAAMYAPNVQRARVRMREGDRFIVDLRLYMKKVIAVVLDTQNEVRYSRISPTRVHVRSRATAIREVREPGTPAESHAPVGRDGGYLWRFNNYCSLEETAGAAPGSPGGGVVVQCESLSLSRGIPPGLGWLVGPFVTGVPRESLEFTLRSLARTLSQTASAVRVS